MVSFRPPMRTSSCVCLLLPLKCWFLAPDKILTIYPLAFFSIFLLAPHICMCVRVYALCVCMWMYVFVCIHSCLCVRPCVRACVHACVCVCPHFNHLLVCRWSMHRICVCICVFVYMYVYMYVCMYEFYIEVLLRSVFMRLAMLTVSE